MSEKTKHTQGFDTRAIHAGFLEDKSNALITPIYANSTFAYEGFESQGQYSYARFGNPTRTSFEKALASLENGSDAFAFSSGMAAISAVFNLLPQGSHIIISDDQYGGTYNLIENMLKVTSKHEVTYMDFSPIDKLFGKIKPNTKMIWVETPSNPLLKIANLREIAIAANDHNILCVADNTFASPYIQKPLDHGFDISLHSTTKYINGHSDIIGGAVVVNNNDLAEKIRQIQLNTGGVPSPFDVFLTHRGLKTLGIRMKKHSENAMKVAEFLHKHPKVEKVFYPGLKSHPQHQLAKEQMKEFGGMISILLKDDREVVKSFLEKLQLFELAVSLGGVESLIQHPATMTHKSIPLRKRNIMGITEGLIRLSIGIEDADDLIYDLKQALDK